MRSYREGADTPFRRYLGYRQTSKSCRESNHSFITFLWVTPRTSNISHLVSCICTRQGLIGVSIPALLNQTIASPSIDKQRNPASATIATPIRGHHIGSSPRDRILESTSESPRDGVGEYPFIPWPHSLVCWLREGGEFFLLTWVVVRQSTQLGNYISKPT